MLKLRFSTLILLFVSLCILSFVLPATSHAAVVNQTLTNRMTSGLIGHWTMDGTDIVNGVMRDRSGQGNHGNFLNISTSTFFKPGVMGQAAHFDGVNDRLDMGDVALYDFDATQSFTVSLWYRSSNNVSNHIISKKQNAAATPGFALTTITTTGGALSYNISDGVDEVNVTHAGITGLNNNKWHHIVSVINRTSNSVQTYIDGTFSNATSISTIDSLASTITLRTAAAGNGGSFSNVMLDDIRIYNTALATTSIQSLYNLGTVALKGNTNVNTRNTKSNLIAHWTLDGHDISTGGVVLDKSGNGNNGNIRSTNFSTTTHYIPGKFGQAILFNGVTGIKIPNNIADNTSALTVSFWVKPKVVGNAGYPLTKTRSTALSIGSWYFSRPSGGTWAFDVVNADGTQSISATKTGFNTTDWMHVVGTYDGTTAQIYINGQAGTSVSSTTAGVVHSAPIYPICIGAASSDSQGLCNGSPYSGIIDDVRIYSVAMTEAEVQQLYNVGGGNVRINTSINTRNSLSSGLVGYWTFDGKDMTNGRVNDVSGNGNHGNASGIATSTFYRPGKIGQAANFDGVNDIIDAGSATVLDDISPLSISLWAKVTGVNGQSSVNFIAKDSSVGGGGGWQFQHQSLGVNNNIGFSAVFSDGLYSAAVAGASPLNQWVHWVVTWDGTGSSSGVSIYKNGIQLSPTFTTRAGSYNSDASATLRIGAGTASARMLPGSLDDVRVYNRVLTTSEVSQLYNMGK